MKKIILYLSLVLVVSSCFMTTVMAAPKITSIQGGYGVTATVEDANGRDWRIGIQGPNMIYGMITEGTISGNSATIHTSIFPPVLGFGQVNIRVTIYRTLLPDIIQTHTAFMVGPFVFLVQHTHPHN